MEQVLLVCHKKQKKNDGSTFDRYFCYKQNEVQDEEGNISYTDEINPATGKAQGVKALLPDDMLKRHGITNNMFPLYMTVDMEATLEVTTKDGSKVTVRACKLKIDRDKEGNPRLDKYGKRHVVCVINDVVKFSEAPRREITWDDVYEIE